MPQIDSSLTVTYEYMVNVKNFYQCNLHTIFIFTASLVIYLKAQVGGAIGGCVEQMYKSDTSIIYCGLNFNLCYIV